MGKEINLNLKKAVEIGGKITKLENGKTNSITLNKLIQNQGFNIEEGTDLCYLIYSNCSRIQALFKIVNISDENSELITIYNAI